ncbi:hypothetical protein RHSIM_Rhsim05G0217900 [Rhododendron simsii]|uniref:Uncharacterized protein n=1 Tax=Rhododendron simsii TaxID=118357 RepID=A0A834GUD5_RHOSS|nr:hypothetical protein RHSIM_Rhsim05G0217900 [Rhododendron simsii]
MSLCFSSLLEHCSAFECPLSWVLAMVTIAAGSVEEVAVAGVVDVREVVVAVGVDARAVAHWIKFLLAFARGCGWKLSWANDVGLILENWNMVCGHKGNVEAGRENKGLRCRLRNHAVREERRWDNLLGFPRMDKTKKGTAVISSWNHAEQATAEINRGAASALGVLWHPFKDDLVWLFLDVLGLPMGLFSFGRLLVSLEDVLDLGFSDWNLSTTLQFVEDLEDLVVAGFYNPHQDLASATDCGDAGAA